MPLKRVKSESDIGLKSEESPSKRSKSDIKPWTKEEKIALVMRLWEWAQENGGSIPKIFGDMYPNGERTAKQVSATCRAGATADTMTDQGRLDVRPSSAPAGSPH